MYDTIIIGAGSMGAAAGFYLANAGKKVLLLDAFNPPHTNGSHHGQTRLIRHAYGEGTAYVPFALAAQKLWNELENLSGRQIFKNTGVLNIGKRDSVFIQNIIQSAEDFTLPVEVLTSSEINERYKGWSVPDEYIGCMETSSGVLFCQEAISAYLDLALQKGADLKINHKVSDIKASDNQVEVVANGQVFTGKTLILSAGGYMPELLEKVDLTLPIQAQRATFSWFEADDTYNEQHFTGFSFETPQGIFYGFPNLDGQGLKIGKHESHPTDIHNQIAFKESDKKDLEDFVATYLKQAGKLNLGKNCIYTLTPDEDFIIDQHPNYPNIAIAAGFSGHGFKFASVVGQVLSQLVSKGTIEYDISKFSIKRFDKLT